MKTEEGKIYNFGGGRNSTEFSLGEDPENMIHVDINTSEDIDIRADVFATVKKKNMSFMDSVSAGVFTVPGDGCLDFKAIFNALKANHYEGLMIVEAEQDPVDANPLEYALLSKKYLENIWSN